MKILKQGVKPEYVWRGVCNCGCVFQLDKVDEGNIVVNYEECNMRDCVKDYTPYFKCPCCGKIVRISKHNSREDTMDEEEAHLKADNMLVDILEEIGLSKVAEEFERFKKWYG